MLNQFSYTMYHAFLKYLYTGNIDLSLEQKFGEFELIINHIITPLLLTFMSKIVSLQIS